MPRLTTTATSTTTTTSTTATPFGFNETYYDVNPAIPFEYIEESPDYEPPDDPTLSPQQQLAKNRKHKELLHENVEVGVMFASKAVVQLITNPFVGPLTNRCLYVYFSRCSKFCNFVIFCFF